MFEKMIRKFEEESNPTTISVGEDYVIQGKAIPTSRAIEIVREEARSGGWIPYSERLPEKDQRCLVQYNGAMSGFEDYMDVDTYNGEMFEFFGNKYVVAWQPLPEKYQKGEHA
ncbi:MAG: DUF551 domain-containing protein [Roseburia sp.]|nr:DUF551 domain-containing protein [Roseburia sp.]